MNGNPSASTWTRSRYGFATALSCSTARCRSGTCLRPDLALIDRAEEIGVSCHVASTSALLEAGRESADESAVRRHGVTSSSVLTSLWTRKRSSIRFQLSHTYLLNRRVLLVIYVFSVSF